MGTTITIKRIRILLRRDFSDIVHLYTDLPCPYVKEFIPSQPPLDLKFECTKDTAEDYVKKHFDADIPVEVVRI